MFERCPQLETAETTSVSLCLCEEQLLTPPAIPIVVPGATVGVPVRMLMVALAQSDDGAETTGCVAKTSASESAPTATLRAFMLTLPGAGRTVKTRSWHGWPRCSVKQAPYRAGCGVICPRMRRLQC